MFKYWDPIGIYDESRDFNADNEYDAYLPEILTLILNNAEPEQIFKILWEIETSDIGLHGDYKHTRDFAEKCGKLFNSI